MAAAVVNALPPLPGLEIIVSSIPGVAAPSSL